jgi:hypothetical protein
MTMVNVKINCVETRNTKFARIFEGPETRQVWGVIVTFPFGRVITRTFCNHEQASKFARGYV